MNRVNTEMVSSTKMLRQKFFAILWSLAILMNNFKQAPGLADSGIEDLLNFVTFALAVSLLLDPKNSYKLLLLSIFGTLQWVGFLPKMPNHWMIIGFVSLAISLTTLGLILKHNKISSSLFQNVGPILRWSLIICYGAAAIAKWNSGFMNPDISCAVVLADRELDWLGIPIDFLSLTPLPFLIALSESLILLFLIITRLNALGVAFAAIFHLLLSLTPVSQGLGFTFTLWALLVLFLPDKSYDVLGKMISKAKAKNRIDLSVYKFMIILVWSYLFIKYLIYPTRNDFDEYFVWSFRLVIGVIIASIITYISLLGFKELRVKRPLIVSKSIQVFVIGIVLFNSLAPYLGIKTHGTMTMYSNIQVEQGKSNHYFLKPISLFPYLSDVVKIESTSWQPLAHQMSLGNEITWVELQRAMSQHPESQITYVRQGNRYQLSRASDNQELVTTHPIIHKLISNRLVSSGNTCLW